MISRRFFISGIVMTSAVASASQFLPVEWPKPYATVYGVGWDFEVVEFQVWTQQDALNFANFGRGGISRFREVTEVVYHVPMEPLPKTYYNTGGAYAIDPSIKWAKTVTVQDDGFTNIVHPYALYDWQDKQRPDLPKDSKGNRGVAWYQEQIAGERDYEANAARYIAEALKNA
jgi:hypothetical protein